MTQQGFNPFTQFFKINLNRTEHVYVTASMIGMVKMGAPLKFGERLVKREFRLPESLNERLTVVARQRGELVSDLLRKSLDRELNGAPDTPLVSDAAAADMTAQIRKMVKSALKGAPPSDELHVTMKDAQQRKLRALSKEYGYETVEELAEDVLSKVSTGTIADLERFFGIKTDVEVRTVTVKGKRAA